MLGKRDLARIFISEVDGQCATGMFALMFGRKVFYVWGGSSAPHRAYQPGALLQWETIKWARLHGYRYYDFHGALVEDPEKYNRHDKTASVALFKKGFGASFVKYMPQHKVVLSPSRYHLTSACRKMLFTIHRLV